MYISLSPETQKLLEQQMQKHGYDSPEEAVRLALEKLDQEESRYIEDLPPETQAAIEEGLAQAARGEGQPWEHAREELRDRFTRK